MYVNIVEANKAKELAKTLIDQPIFFLQYGMQLRYPAMTPSPPLRNCCAPLLTHALSNEEVSRLAAIFRVLGEPTRLHLLRLIAAQPNGEVCACDLVEPLGLAQPTVSHHLKVMYEAGLVERDRRGTWIYYRIVPGAIALLRDALT